MNRDTETMLVLASHVLNFATRHPYAATGIFGAALGSAVTYKVMTDKQAQKERKNGVFTPKCYKIVLQPNEVRHLLEDPTTEIHWETPEMSVVITSEEPVPMKQLPVIDIKVEVE